MQASATAVRCSGRSTGAGVYGEKEVPPSLIRGLRAQDYPAELFDVVFVDNHRIETLSAGSSRAWRVPPTWLDRLRRAATMEVGRGRVESVRGMADQLTDREREVLRLLPSRLTLREIAAELSISMNTLKFHLKVIYRKLQCGSRTEAAEIARGLTQLRQPGQGPSTFRR